MVGTIGDDFTELLGWLFGDCWFFWCFCWGLLTDIGVITGSGVGFQACQCFFLGFLDISRFSGGQGGSVLSSEFQCTGGLKEAWLVSSV